MGKRTSEFMRSVHIKTIQADLQQGKSIGRSYAAPAVCWRLRG